MYNSSRAQQPSPIGTNYNKRPHEDEDYCHGSNAGSKKLASDASAIFRSVTAEDDNDMNNLLVAASDSGNADFSTSILMGSNNLTASTADQARGVDIPALWAHDDSIKNAIVPSNDTHEDRGISQLMNDLQIPIAGDNANHATADAPLMPTTSYSPLQQQSTPVKASLCQGAEEGKEADENGYIDGWTCDICKICSFATLEEASSHEISCKIIHDAKKKKGAQKKQKKEAQRKSKKKKKTQEGEKLPSAVTSLVLKATPSEENNTASIAGPTRHPNVVLIPPPEKSNILSEYNNLLVRNVEFFYPSDSHLDYDNLSGSMNGALMSKNRLGLRCIHCKNNPNHVTAAAFFPRTIGSIASGLGTIGTRHFGWGKCPFAGTELVEQMIEAKKTSGNETRAKGRVGLDAYCKDLASRCGIYDDQLSGICWDEESNNRALAAAAAPPSLPTSATSLPLTEIDSNANAAAALLAGMKNSTNIETRSFVPTTTEHFWECNGCRMVPLEFRARGSVVFSAGQPSNEQVAKHLRICGGDKPLTIPHNATIEPYYGEEIPPIKITWNQSTSLSEAAPLEVPSNSGRISRRSSNSIPVKTGIEDDPLCFDEDKEYTTDFAFFTVTQLKKCYLTKEGGSRGSCPLGYPGLACAHCAGTENERRFFYTTADHLRNSFSHIPSHMNECSMCPQEVKDRLEEFKKVRNSQKSSLKVGYHKIFIDRVWQRLHEKDSGTQQKLENLPNTNTSGSSRVGTRMYNASQKTEKLTLPAVDSLVVEEDKSLTSDLIFYTLQQLEPYKPRQNKCSYDDEEEEREIGFPVRANKFDLSDYCGENSILPLELLSHLQGLVCKHCKSKVDGRKFFTTSAEHLGGLLLTISNHVAICRDCPVPVKTQIISNQFTHESQLQSKKENHDAYMKEVWRRLVILSKRKEKPRTFSHNSRRKSSVRSFGSATSYPTVDPNLSLVVPEDEQLVTPFTFCTMDQCRPCNLDIKGNGSRSNFDHGWPGLECKWCIGPKPRRFFYRTAEILAGNYSHIPNHLLNCSGVPASLKATLVQLKQEHQTLKHQLDRGTQKQFFANVWNRLHNPSTSNDLEEVADQDGETFEI